MRIRTHSAAETRALGRRLGETAASGDLLGLAGELGTGKTVLVQGLGEGLGVGDPVHSPGFVLVHEYPGRRPLVHVDLYRLDGAEASLLGLEDYRNAAAVMVVEWAERLPEGFAADYLMVRFEFAPGEEERELSFRAHGPRSAAWLARARLSEGRPAGTPV